MTIDTSQPISQGDVPDWTLPEIVEIEPPRLVANEAPRLRNFRSALSEFEQVVEFVVHTSGPIPARALSPALFIGETPVIESQQLEEGVYRFRAFQPDRLENGAPITWGWLNEPPETRQRTGFEYRPDW